MPGLFILPLCLIFTPPDAPVVEVQATHSAQPMVAEWQSIDPAEMVVVLGGDRITLPVEGLQAVHFPEHAPRPTDTAFPIVTLRDGSRLIPAAIEGDGQTVQLQLGQGTLVRLAATDISAIQFQTLSAAQRGQWEAIVDSRIVSDTLVVLRSTTDSLDTIEGLVESVDAEQVAFDFGGQQVNAPRTRLAGLRFFGPPAPTAVSTAGVLTDVWGNSWHVSSLSAGRGADTMELQLTGGAMVQLPLAAVATIDFSIARVQYLAELTPLRQTRLGGLEFRGPISGSDQLFGAQSLQLAKTRGPSLQFVGCGTATYRIPDGYRQLSGTVYLAPSGNRFSPCTVQVKLESETLWEQELAHPSQRLDILVPVQAEQRLQISVLPLVQFPVGNVVIWQELRLLR